ncbi:LOW QUALITY PROTEIN: olfactory receptor 52A4-like, partial [Glossophaga mutica]
SATPITNGMVFMPSVITLIGIPGLETIQSWVGIPFFPCVYFIVSVGNSLLLLIIKLEPSLHKPTYIFLATLGATEIAPGTSIVPKMLGNFWLHLPEIHFDACLFSMLIHTFQGIEAGVLLAIALDHYIASYPLKHTTTFTQQIVTHIGVSVALRPAILVMSCLLLIKWRLKFCESKLIPHTYCEHMALVKLATEDVYIHKFYGLFGAFIVGSLDFILITFSCIQIFITIFHLPQKEACLKAFNTCIPHIRIFFQFYFLVFYSFFTHSSGSYILSYIHIMLSNILLSSGSLVPKAFLLGLLTVG